MVGNCKRVLAQTQVRAEKIVRDNTNHRETYARLTRPRKSLRGSPVLHVGASREEAPVDRAEIESGESRT